MNTELPSLGELLDEVAGRFEQAELFFGHGTDNAWDEAVYLVFCALRIPFDSADEIMSRPIGQDELAHVEDLVRRRIEERVPVAYLVGEAWFAGLPFEVSEEVLVPRSPIAELIQQQFATLLPRDPERILDLCTGSGCIGIASALVFPEARVDLADISESALALARRNVERHGLQARAQVLHSDLFAGLASPYDLIVTNPPYVSQEEVDELPAEYRHEPSLGLVSADDGLEIPLRILREASDWLTPEGVLILEVGYSREALADRLPQVPLLWLEFANGGEGICLLTRRQLLDYREHFV
jgi:ribosomal protein L3 glutamine methyltransferase